MRADLCHLVDPPLPQPKHIIPILHKQPLKKLHPRHFRTLIYTHPVLRQPPTFQNLLLLNFITTSNNLIINNNTLQNLLLVNSLQLTFSTSPVIAVIAFDMFSYVVVVGICYLALWTDEGSLEWFEFGCFGLFAQVAFVTIVVGIMQKLLVYCTAWVQGRPNWAQFSYGPEYRSL